MVNAGSQEFCMESHKVRDPWEHLCRGVLRGEAVRRLVFFPEGLFGFFGVHSHARTLSRS